MALTPGRADGVGRQISGRGQPLDRRREERDEHSQWYAQQNLDASRVLTKCITHTCAYACPHRSIREHLHCHSWCEAFHSPATHGRLVPPRSAFPCIQLLDSSFQSLTPSKTKNRTSLSTRDIHPVFHQHRYLLTRPHPLTPHNAPRPLVLPRRPARPRRAARPGAPAAHHRPRGRDALPARGLVAPRPAGGLHRRREPLVRHGGPRHGVGVAQFPAWA